ncbi:hypothetical protein KPH14_000910, partial [Odynerus spinipes]
NHDDKLLSALVNQLVQVDKDLVKEREVSRELASEATKRLRKYNKSYYDSKHKRISTYQVGDYVMIRDLQAKPGQNTKLKHTYKGRYMVSKILNKNRYVIRDIPGHNVSSRPYDSILSPDKLKPWVKPVRIN